MCKVIILKEMLGSRETCYSAWTPNGVKEMTSREIKRCLSNGEKICGLTTDSNGELVLDKDGFFTNNLLIHRHCGQYEAMIDNDETIAANLFYIVMGKEIVNGVTMYKAITTRFKEVLLSESDVLAYLKLGILSAGCRLDENGKIEVASLTHEVPNQNPLEKQPEQPKPSEPIKAEVKEPEKKPEPPKPAEPKKEENRKSEPAKPIKK